MNYKIKNIKERTKNELNVYITLISAIVLGAVIARVVIHIWHPVLVNGDSMNPTYKNGEVLTSTVEFTNTDIKRGDIVTFENEGIPLIKRVVGVPGDKLCVKNGMLYINNVAEPEYQYAPIKHAGILSYETVLAEDEYFCMGDNRNNSVDCRVFGPVKFSEINGLITGQVFTRKGAN